MTLGPGAPHLPSDPAPMVKLIMADHGEWNRKGAVLSDVTAQKEHGVTREFVVAGINAGKLEYREGSVWGHPYLQTS